MDSPPGPDITTSSRSGAMLQLAAALLWLPQAGLLAWAVQQMADGQPMRQLLAAAAGVLALGMLRAWCDGSGVLRAHRAARTVLSRLRARALQALAHASPLDKARPSSGRAASVLAEQAEAMVPWLARYQCAMWRVRVVPMAIAAVVASQSWLAALILILAAPLIPLFMAIVGWRARAASEEQLAEMGGMNAFLLDRLRGLSTLRALGAVESSARRLRAHAEALRQRTMRVLRIAFLSSAVLELFSALGVAMVAVYVGFHLLGTLPFGAWGQKLSLGEALFVLLLAPAFFEPLRELSAVWHDRAAGEAALEALEELHRQGASIVGSIEAERMPPAPSTAAAVDIVALEVRAPGSDTRLEALNLHIEPGEHVTLWSPSGSGKSVLLAQIAGLVPVAGGEIRIDGQPLNAETAAAMRARIAWMGQHAHVFAGSMPHNVSLGRAHLGADDVRTAAEQAALGAVLQARAASSLGEGGSGLSGGEVLRLALARLAVNRDAGLLLVDEPTAHLDPVTAGQIIDSLLRIARGRTLIVATHDAQLAQRMDRVIRLPWQPHPRSADGERR
ncbi:thiol reductant ABC exporter subunit CydD [Thauera sp. Sel9]|uniref:thiol reductant ABC exporter subunit CydD n=1 Tax=Thauera sp. Sel9 TaxID=2974299 RepID=UPI0021E11798|nr:thiol reductant ABC exporter subunit CydD [Thauera sp. Sel9]MCV2216912.1 thiol reductant ABC exporter subunit CydD [Thauera sp. Sel9]